LSFGLSLVLMSRNGSLNPI